MDGTEFQRGTNEGKLIPERAQETEDLKSRSVLAEWWIQRSEYKVIRKCKTKKDH